ncbi:MAG: tetratricopeptide repeat protein [Candidatus Delongbacteria bacterium]
MTTESRPRWIAALLILVAVLLRVDWHLAFRELPLYFSPAIDEALHWDWAQRLAAGLGSPERPYFRAPLYPWWLGLLQRGELGLAGLRWAGSLLGLGSLLLMAWMGARWLGRGAALWLLALGGLSGAWIYYEPQLLLEHQVLFLLLTATLAWLGLQERPPGLADAGLGLALSLAALTRPNALLLAPLAVFLLLRMAEPAGQRLRRLAWWSVGWLPPLLLVAALNGWPGSGVLVASQGGVNLWIGNNPQADGRSAVLPGTGHAWERADAREQAQRLAGRTLTAGEEDRLFQREARRWVLEHPVAAARLTLRKLGWLLGPAELGNNTSPPVLAARRSWLAGLLALSWWSLALPGLLGLALGLPRNRALRHWLLGALLLYAGSFLPFFITGRFRLPLLPLLAFPAAELLVELGRRLRRDSAAPPWRPDRLRMGLAGLVVLALGAAGLFEARALDSDEARSQAGWQHFQLGNAWLRLGAEDSARVAYERALAAWPALPEVRLNLGLLARAQHPARAESLFRAELELDPRSAKAWNNLGTLRQGLGDLPGARACYREALRLRPGLQDAAWNLGLVECQLGLAAAARGERAAAEQAWRAAWATPYRGRGLSRLRQTLDGLPESP